MEISKSEIVNFKANAINKIVNNLKNLTGILNTITLLLKLFKSMIHTSMNKSMIHTKKV
jgi:hypothetical protein